MKNYSRLQNIAAQMGLRDSLTHIWAFTVNMTYGFDLPFEYQGLDLRDPERGPPASIREFHLDLYAREVIMHAGASRLATRSLQYQRDRAALHNAILGYSDARTPSRGDIYLTLHRLSHEQMPHFDRADWAYLGRYWLLFRQPAISQLFEKVIGLTSFDYLRCTAGMFTIYINHPQCRPVDDLAVLGLPKAALDQCLVRMTATATQLRMRMRSNMRHSDVWQYTFNELIATPLVQLPTSRPGDLFCPRPPLMLKRMLSGVLHDLFKADHVAYASALGDGVDAAVGAICEDLLATPAEKPESYGPKGKRRDGVDWIIHDETGCVFVECKATRLSKGARIAETISDLREGMRHVAAAIAQNASNIHDVVEGRANWGVRDRPSFSLVVTLEDPVIFSPFAAAELRALAEERLREKGLSPSLLDAYPYTVIPIQDLPDILTAVSNEGVSTVFNAKADALYEGYMMSAFLRESGRSTTAGRAYFNRLGTDLFRNIIKTIDAGHAERLRVEDSDSVSA